VKYEEYNCTFDRSLDLSGAQSHNSTRTDLFKRLGKCSYTIVNSKSAKIIQFAKEGMVSSVIHNFVIITGPNGRLLQV
jgi:hypothetical protein